MFSGCPAQRQSARREGAGGYSATQYRIADRGLAGTGLQATIYKVPGAVAAQGQDPKIARLRLSVYSTAAEISS